MVTPCHQWHPAPILHRLICGKLRFCPCLLYQKKQYPFLTLIADTLTVDEQFAAPQSASKMQHLEIECRCNMLSTNDEEIKSNWRKREISNGKGGNIPIHADTNTASPR